MDRHFDQIRRRRCIRFGQLHKTREPGGGPDTLGQTTRIYRCIRPPEFDTNAPVPIVGDYGTVGAELASLASTHWPLLLTGRNPVRGRRLGEELGARVAQWDVTDPRRRARDGEYGQRSRRPRTAVRRARGHPLRRHHPLDNPPNSGRRGRRDAAPHRTVLLSSSWMGGVTGSVTAALAEQVGGANEVDIAIRYTLADRAVVDSVNSWTDSAWNSR